MFIQTWKVHIYNKANRTWTEAGSNLEYKAAIEILDALKKQGLDVGLSPDEGIRVPDPMPEEKKPETVESIRNAIFLLEMKDHWTSDDYAESRRLEAKLRELENKQ